MWGPQGRHKTGTTGGNSLRTVQQWMEHNDDDLHRGGGIFLVLGTGVTV